MVEWVQRRVPAAECGLQAHCLAFCSALATHHLGEDDGM